MENIIFDELRNEMKKKSENDLKDLEKSINLIDDLKKNKYDDFVSGVTIIGANGPAVVI